MRLPRLLTEPAATGDGNVLYLAAVGEVRSSLLDPLVRSLGAQFNCRCEVLPWRLDPEYAFHAERMQYHSSELLEGLRRRAGSAAWRVLGVTESDLYIPILTFVFGEAQVGGPCAVVSTFRLRQEFYGLPPDDALLQERLLKESVHELGHTFDLPHCEDYRCAMASSHSVEWIDVKSASFCSDCRLRMGKPDQARAWP